MPFLERVTRGRNVPRDRLESVAQHYLALGGVSPIMEHTRALRSALEAELGLPVVWGNRHAAPFVADALHELVALGAKEVIGITTSAFGSYSGCRQYREDVERARALVERAPAVQMIGPYGEDGGFLAAQIDRVREVMIDGARIVFTAHSIPIAMSVGSPYEAQLRAACERVASAIGADWELAWQSRSGAPEVPWLSPDVLEVIERSAEQEPGRAITIVPIGFTSDHVEVVWDLDREARARAEALGVPMARAGTVGTHPRFVAALAERVRRGAAPTGTCGPGCCPSPARR